MKLRAALAGDFAYRRRRLHGSPGAKKGQHGRKKTGRAKL